MMTSENRTGGFTLVELIVTVSIICIMAALAVTSVSTYIAEKNDERQVVGLWKQLKGFRMKVLKTENRHVIIFNTLTGTPAYTAYQDPTSDGTGTVLTMTDVSVDVPSVTFGAPDNCTSGPNGLSISGGSISASWNHDSGLVFQKNFMGSIASKGYVVMKSPKSSNKIGYIIMADSNSQDLRLYKFKGGTWFQL